MKGKQGFQKGDPNINRGGRPPKGKTFVDKFYQYINDDEFIQIGLKLVREGDRDLWKYFADRVYGKIKEHVQLDGEVIDSFSSWVKYVVSNSVDNENPESNK